MPFKNKEDYNAYMRAYRARKNANWHDIEEPEKYEPEKLPELEGYGNLMQEPRYRQNDPFRPRLDYKGHADNPEAYGISGIAVCSVCGSVLDKNGECPNRCCGWD